MFKTVQVPLTKHLLSIILLKSSDRFARECIKESCFLHWRLRADIEQFGTTEKSNQNSIAEEMKSRLRSGNACYHSVQSILSSTLLHKNLNIKIYRSIILPVVLHGCETWSLKLQERKLWVFENMMLRRIFGPRRDEVTGEWRRLHNEELNDLHYSPNILWVIKSKRMRWAGHVARMGEERGVYRVLVGKP